MDEPCVYKKTSESAVVFLILYVDDILLIENNISILQSIKTWLLQKFFKKDLGEVSFILSIKIYKDRSKRMLGSSRSRCIDIVWKRFNIEKSKRVYLPMGHGIQLSKKISPKTPEEKNRMSSIPYFLTVGSIMYAMLCIRPNVAYALDIVSKFQANPREDN